MTSAGYAFLGLTAIVAMLAAVLMFAVLKFIAAARETRNRREHGTESTLLASALEDAIARLKAQQRATAARAEASERFSDEIVASLASGLLVVDRDGTISTANPAARRILAGEGVSIDQKMLLDAAPALRDVIEESLRSGQAVLRRAVTVHGPTGAMHLGVTVSPLSSDTGPPRAICLFTDLTSVLALEEQLRLKEALARLGELTAGLAHEFRNGLATIHGYARLLDPSTLPDPQRQYVEGLRSETQALGEVVTNFLNFARPDPLSLTEVDLRTIVQRAVDDVGVPGISIEGTFGAINADDVLMRQAMSNLLRNSVEACAGAGVTPAIAVAGEVDAAHGSATVHVIDNGPGIPLEARDRLFQPFFTLRRGGTGLGLAIVQKIVVGHNGRISAGNHPDGGAIFTVTLPLSREVRATET